MVLTRKKKKVPVKRLREIIDKLRFAAMCLPAGCSLMTPFNMALREDLKEIGLGKKEDLYDCLGNWLALIRSQANRLMRDHIDWCGLLWVLQHIQHRHGMRVAALELMP